jgi:hypothetical protein
VNRINFSVMRSVENVKDLMKMKGLEVCDDGILVKLLTFWPISILMFFLLKTMFQRLNPFSVLR